MHETRADTTPHNALNVVVDAIYPSLIRLLAGLLILVLCAWMVAGGVAMVQALGGAFSGHWATAAEHTIINALIMLALLEVIRTLQAYLRLGRVRVTFILDTALVVLIGEFMGLWFREYARKSPLAELSSNCHLSRSPCQPMTTAPTARPHILFLCTGNSCRSQMAEGWARQLGGDALIAESAGIEAHGKNPRAITVMAEAGVDISSQESTRVTDAMIARADVVVTVCGHADEHCPALPPGKRKIHWPLTDPAKATGTEDEIMAQFRATRDEARQHAQALLYALKTFAA